MKLAEEMTFIMLLYDFEVARRLHRPINPDSQDLDFLPIGIGNAMIHRINSQRQKLNWVFFSRRFKDTRKSRKSALHQIVTRSSEN